MFNVDEYGSVFIKVKTGVSLRFPLKEYIRVFRMYPPVVCQRLLAYWRCSVSPKDNLTSQESYRMYLTYTKYLSR